MSETNPLQNQHELQRPVHTDPRHLGNRAFTNLDPKYLPQPQADVGPAPQHETWQMDEKARLEHLARNAPDYSVDDLPTLPDGRRDYSKTSLGAAGNKKPTWIRPLNK